MDDAVPLHWNVDLEHGGRWTSWQAAGREWLWCNRRLPAGARTRVRPGDPFVDAGGAEECFPTVRGRPDHGDVWSRSWSGSPSDAAVDVPGTGTLRRTVTAGPHLQIGYRIDGKPGTRFLHALHALLAVGDDAVLHVPDAETMIVLDEEEPARRWPSSLDRLGPDDGTAVCAIIPGVRRAVVTDGPDRLEFAWDCPEAPDLCSLMLWRNLRGWPADAPYRSIGVEPMIGRAADLTSGVDDCPVIGSSGTFGWSLHITGPSRRGPVQSPGCPD